MVCFFSVSDQFCFLGGVLIYLVCYSNETLLSKYREAGINVPREQFEIDLDPRQKFRSVIGAVRATIRMRMWARQWKGMKRMGAAIEKARAKTEALTGHKCTP